jgi:hypothetical protein
MGRLRWLTKPSPPSHPRNARTSSPRAAAILRVALSLEKAISFGLNSGE